MQKAEKYLSTLSRAAAVDNTQLFINMIKLSELINKEPLQPNGRPENRNANVGFNQGFPWSFDDPSGIYESEETSKIHQALIGREFQTLEDIKKICSRLRQAGFTQSDIDIFIKNYTI